MYFYPITRLLVEMDGYRNTEIETDVDYSSIRVDNEIEEASISSYKICCGFIG